MYHVACPSNFRQHEPKPVFFLVLFFYIIVQAVALGVQAKYGSRVFVPAFILKPQFSYYKTPAEEAKLVTEASDCVICMTPLSQNRAKAHGSRTMHAPCGHKFHTDCLCKWLDVKSECPTCRSALPAVEE